MMSSFSGFDYRPKVEGDPRYAISRIGNNHPPHDDCEPSLGCDFNHPPPDYGENEGEPRYTIHQDYKEGRYVINVRIMVSALIVLLLVVLLLILLHIYARWFWRQSARLFRQRSASRRHRFLFTGQEPASLLNLGLDSAVLGTLPMFVYKSQSFADELECAVCLSELEENEKARLLPNCRHTFHVECIDMWFISHSTCPVCRTCARPKQLFLESIRIEQVSATIPGLIPSGIHDNLNSEQGQTAVSGEDYNMLIQEHPCRFSTGDPT